MTLKDKLLLTKNWRKHNTVDCESMLPHAFVILYKRQESLKLSQILCSRVRSQALINCSQCLLQKCVHTSRNI